MIILASKSPRRIEGMKKFNIPFKIIPANIDEDKYPIEEVSFHKAKNISLLYPSSTILSADTFVRLEGIIYGKPIDKKNAYEILSSLSNKTHEVVTYFTIINENKKIFYNESVVSFVTFNDLTKAQIDEYINSLSPLDKAGAYGIQDNEKYHIIKEFQGSYDNIVGFPSNEIYNALKNLNLI